MSVSSEKVFQAPHCSLSAQTGKLRSPRRWAVKGTSKVLLSLALQLHKDGYLHKRTFSATHTRLMIELFRVIALYVLLRTIKMSATMQSAKHKQPSVGKTLLAALPSNDKGVLVAVKSGFAFTFGFI